MKKLQYILVGVAFLLNQAMAEEWISIDSNVSELINKISTVENNLTKYRDTIIYAKSAKSGFYKVNESIEIKLKLKRDAYIYFWTLGSSGKVYQILPNSFESNVSMYKKNKEYSVPDKNSSEFDFVSDRAGVEHIYILAANKPIPKKELEKIFRKKVEGVIPLAVPKDFDAFIKERLYSISKESDLMFDIEEFEIKVIQSSKKQEQ